MKQRGFTLIELMVTLVVLVVLMTMAVPSFMDYMQKARVRGAVDSVTNVLARARQAAVKSNMPIAVAALQKGGGAWCVGARQPSEPGAWQPRPLNATSCNCSTTATACVVEDEQLLADSTALGSNAPTISITGFDFSYSPKLGGVSDNGAPGRVFLTSAASQLDVASANSRYLVRVIVTPLGQSYACIPAGYPPFSGYKAC
jgi:type IV fimbrial biogenesis protein FimT